VASIHEAVEEADYHEQKRSISIHEPSRSEHDITLRDFIKCALFLERNVCCASLPSSTYVDSLPRYQADSDRWVIRIWGESRFAGHETLASGFQKNIRRPFPNKLLEQQHAGFVFRSSDIDPGRDDPSKSCLQWVFKYKTWALKCDGSLDAPGKTFAIGIL